MKKTLSRILALPNGSLSKPSMSVVEKTGINISTNGRKFLLNITGTSLFDQAIFMRPQDMPAALERGLVSAAICGMDCLIESGLEDRLKIITELYYSKKTNKPTRLVIFGKTREFIDNENILVSAETMNIASQIFKKAVIHFSHGGTEQKVAYLGYDYGICTVETGESLNDNGLVIVKEILTSPTILLTREETPELKYFGKLLQGALTAENFRLIKMNVDKKILSKVLKDLPSINAPTINKLANGNYSVETIVSEPNTGNILMDLLSIGATGILVQKIETMC